MILYPNTYPLPKLHDIEIVELNVKLKHDTELKTGAISTEVLLFMLWLTVALGISFVCLITCIMMALMGWF